MFPYIPGTPEDEKEMLQNIGATSSDELFCDIQGDVKLKHRLNLNSPLSEMEVFKSISGLADKNKTSELTCFLGAGSYDHYIPAVVKHIISKPEFYTAYTPYQPEISQGTLQAIFEYQTMIVRLTCMDVANASLYDGATACVEAAMLAMESTKRKKILVSKTVYPETRQVINTYMRFHGGTVEEVGSLDGVTNIDDLKSKMDDNTAAVIMQNPNFFGVIEEMNEIEQTAHSKKALFIMCVNPISLGVLKTPGEIGADIAVGEGQPLGNPMGYGGPYLGFMAVTNKLMRKIPGRVTGLTEDIDGKRGFVLTLQAREQHIRRQRATSNICSNEALNALAAAVYMAVMGKRGIKEVASQCAAKTRYAIDSMTRSGKYKLSFDRPVFNEFAVTCNKDGAYIRNALLEKNIIGGYELSREYPELMNSMLFCVTEKRTKAEIDYLVEVMEGIE